MAMSIGAETSVEVDGIMNRLGATLLAGIVDATGTIRWIDVHPDYVTRTEPAQILATFDAL